MYSSINLDLEKPRESHEEPESLSPHSSGSTTSSSQARAGPEALPPLRQTESHLSRASTQGLERVNTALSVIRARRQIPPFSHPLSHQKTDLDVIVDFDGPDDPYRPMNWKFNKKVWTTGLYGVTTMGSTFASSVFSPAINQVSDEFSVGTEVSTLGVSLLLFGFGIGPLLWAPLSEIYGRKKAVLIPYFIATCFSFATGASKDIQSICITRWVMMIVHEKCQADEWQLLHWSIRCCPDYQHWWRPG